jgi:chromosome partitioning protein
MTYDPGNSGALSYLQAARELVESHHARLEAAAPVAEAPAAEAAGAPDPSPAGAQDESDEPAAALAEATGQEPADQGGDQEPADQGADQETEQGADQAATVVDLRTGPLDLRGSWTPDRSTASRRRAAERRA